GKPRVSTYTSVPFHVAWAEMQSGIDLTPCHDDKGWNPGPDCKGRPINPGTGVGTWANSCAGQTLMVIPTCGGDGGVPMADAAPMPMADAGATDIGGAPDSGKPATIADAGQDSGPGMTSGMPPVMRADGGAAADGGPSKPPGATSSDFDNGCACNAASSGAPPLAGALLLLGLMMTSRRRRGSRR
ncbi:MAG TPA: MYXO-CTERM sorting domain-containing protein, partial [Polyangia bacterium]|nr:MYXO-CTERM sorting domain-containing protein [Polyangia bacterium]